MWAGAGISTKAGESDRSFVRFIAGLIENRNRDQSTSNGQSGIADIVDTRGNVTVESQDGD